MTKLIIAHRGACKLAPENTLEAFQKAVDLGADMIELDVRKTRDGALVVRHDEILKGRLIRNLDYDRLLSLDGKIPTLEEALKLTAGKIKLDIELKEQGCEKEVIGLALKYFTPERFVVTSFRGLVVGNIKKQYPRISAGLLIEPFCSTLFHSIVYLDAGYFFDSLENRRGIAAAADFLAVSRRLRRRPSGKSLYVYTVDRPAEIKKLLDDKNVAGIITNRPDLALQLKSYGNAAHSSY